MDDTTATTEDRPNDGEGTAGAPPTTGTAPDGAPAAVGPGRRAPLIVGVGVVLAGSAAAALLLVGRDGPEAAAPPPPPPAVAPAPTPAPTVVTPEPEPEPAVEPTASPVTVRIPRLEVDAEIVSVGIEADGEMEIPRDVRTVGWYDPEGFGGVVPGASGTAVLAGHVDSASQGRGSFYDLKVLEVGDTIEVVHDDGTTSSWIVNDRKTYDKDYLPVDAIFVWEGIPRLVLITCGGPFDRASGHYTENIVVLALPA